MFASADLVQHIPALTKFAMRLTRNNYADADDLVQSTILRAMEKADQFQNGTNLFHWTSRILYTQFVTQHRRRCRFETQYDPENFIETLHEDARQESQTELSQVTRAMEKLSPEHRSVLVMVCVQGMSYEETAESLNIPVGTVRSRLSRAREQLAGELQYVSSNGAAGGKPSQVDFRRAA